MNKHGDDTLNMPEDSNNLILTSQMYTAAFIK